MASIGRSPRTARDTRPSRPSSRWRAGCPPPACAPSSSRSGASSAVTRRRAHALRRRPVERAASHEVRTAPGHPGAEVQPHGPEDHDRPAGHVLAAVRADPLDHGPRAASCGPRTASRRGRRRGARRPSRRSRQTLPGQRVTLPSASLGRTDDDRAARQALADVVVRLAGDLDPHPGDRERPEALAGRPGELVPDVRQLPRLRAGATARRPAARRCSGRPASSTPGTDHGLARARSA